MQIHAVGICCCLKIFNSVLSMVVDGVSTWAKLDGYICPVIMQKYLPFIMCCEVCCCLHIHFLQTCEHMSAHWAIKVYRFVKFHIPIY